MLLCSHHAAGRSLLAKSRKPRKNRALTYGSLRWHPPPLFGYPYYYLHYFCAARGVAINMSKPHPHLLYPPKAHCVKVQGYPTSQQGTHSDIGGKVSIVVNARGRNPHGQDEGEQGRQRPRGLVPLLVGGMVIITGTTAIIDTPATLQIQAQEHHSDPRLTGMSRWKGFAGVGQFRRVRRGTLQVRRRACRVSGIVQCTNGKENGP